MTRRGRRRALRRLRDLVAERVCAGRPRTHRRETNRLGAYAVLDERDREIRDGLTG